jgi:hypothetical protein
VVGGLFHHIFFGLDGEAIVVCGFSMIGSYILKSLFISGILFGEIDFFADLVGELGDSFNLLSVLYKLLFIGEFGNDLIGDKFG